MLEHVLALVGIHAAVGRYVGYTWLFVEIVLDDLGDEGVDDLVIGHTGTRRIGETDLARLPRPHESRHAERGIRPEGLGIHEFVVDAAVDHIHALGP